MANKFKPGIPVGFTLDVQPVNDLGDYLDEPRPAPVVPRKAREEVSEPAPATPAANTAVRATPVVETPAAQPRPATPANPVVRQTVVAAPQSQSVQAPVVSLRDEAERQERRERPKAPRREISMTPDTLRMSDELLELIRRGSGQRDTKANELIHALVLLAFEVKDELDPHAIPKRGRWGTPTARAYPLELKNAFLQALLKKYAEADEVPFAGVQNGA